MAIHELPTVGDRVRVVAGAHGGLEGTVTRVLPASRTWARIQLLKGERTVRIEQLEAIGAAAATRSDTS